MSRILLRSSLLSRHIIFTFFPGTLRLTSVFPNPPPMSRKDRKTVSTKIAAVSNPFFFAAHAMDTVLLFSILGAFALPATAKASSVEALASFLGGDGEEEVLAGEVMAEDEEVGSIHTHHFPLFKGKYLAVSSFL